MAIHSIKFYGYTAGIITNLPLNQECLYLNSAYSLKVIYEGMYSVRS